MNIQNRKGKPKRSRQGRPIKTSDSKRAIVTLKQGDVVAWVDNQPAVLLYGDLPVWREMREDTEGPDVLQLETALAALGYDETGSMTVDEAYSAATAAVVEEWQEAIGAEDTYGPHARPVSG